jgi:hypothetical protein
MTESVSASASMRDTNAQPFHLAEHVHQRYAYFVIHRDPF